MAMLKCPAPAKLNLFLHVTGRRNDGYHLLQTVFRLLDFSDQLQFNVRQDGIIKRSGTINIPEEEDLCIRAAKLLKQQCGTDKGVEISLTKQIPLGGGLGGGSSDAATTLLALNYLWDAGLDKNQLIELGLQLGADVPVFIFGENAFAQGVGEKLEPISLPAAWYLVLVPPLQISTAEVFSSKELTRNTIPITIPPFSVYQGHNDLEPVVCKKYPEVAKQLEWLKQLKNTTIVAMSGSGACVFAEFESEAASRAALIQIPQGMDGFVARGLDSHPMRKYLQ